LISREPQSRVHEKLEGLGGPIDLCSHLLADGANFPTLSRDRIFRDNGSPELIQIGLHNGVRDEGPVAVQDGLGKSPDEGKHLAFLAKVILSVLRALRSEVLGANVFRNERRPVVVLETEVRPEESEDERSHKALLAVVVLSVLRYGPISDERCLELFLGCALSLDEVPEDIGGDGPSVAFLALVNLHGGVSEIGKLQFRRFGDLFHVVVVSPESVDDPGNHLEYRCAEWRREVIVGVGRRRSRSPVTRRGEEDRGEAEEGKRRVAYPTKGCEGSPRAEYHLEGVAAFLSPL
jgi:hypothetical protein